MRRLVALSLLLALTACGGFLYRSVTLKTGEVVPCEPVEEEEESP